MMKPIELPIPETRDLYLSGYVDNDSVTELVKKINNIRMSDASVGKYLSKHFPNVQYTPDNIQLHICSHGGSVYDGLNLITTMQAQNMTAVDTYCYGYAFSMAAVIFLCGDNRHASKYTTFGLHEVSSITLGRLSELEIEFSEVKRLQSIIDDIVLKNSLIPRRVWEIKKKEGDWYIPANEARKLGMYDREMLLEQRRIVKAKKEEATSEK